MNSPHCLWAAIGLLLLAFVRVDAQETARSADPPRLVVLLAIDQLASWVLEDALPHLGDSGLKRIAREGASFPRCSFRHTCTFTGPGHATIGTGATPSAHGIVGNTWHDPTISKARYCCDDAEMRLLPGPEGVPGRSPKWLTAPTLGDTLKAHLGGRSQVVGLSWKDRSSILMTGRSADLALWIDYERGLLQTSSYYVKETPRFVHAINEVRPWDRYFGQDWVRAAPDSAFAGLTDERFFEMTSPGGNRSLPRRIHGGRASPGPSYYTQLGSSPFANEFLFEIAKTTIATLELGKDEFPDLFAFSISATDIIGHGCGPKSVEVRDMLWRVDVLIAGFLQFLDNEIGSGRYALVLSSDHGIAPVPETLKPLRIAAGRGGLVLRAAKAANAALVARFGPAPQDLEKWVRAYDDTSIFLHQSALRAAGHDLELASRTAADGAAGAEGIAIAIATQDLLRGLHPDDRVFKDLARSVVPSRTGDVQILKAPYWLEGVAATTHGSAWNYDQEVPLLVMGPGLRKGCVSDAEVTPGAGVVILSKMLRIPAPARAYDALPTGVFESR